MERERADSVGKLGILADEPTDRMRLMPQLATGGGLDGRWNYRAQPLQFEYGRSIGTNLITWPNEHVAKCLVFYHPDDPTERRLEQETRVLYQATQASGHELLLEIIPPKERTQLDTVYRCLKQFYDLGIKPEVEA